MMFELVFHARNSRKTASRCPTENQGNNQCQWSTTLTRDDTMIHGLTFQKEGLDGH